MERSEAGNTADRATAMRGSRAERCGRNPTGHARAHPFPASPRLPRLQPQPPDPPGRLSFPSTPPGPANRRVDSFRPPGACSYGPPTVGPESGYGGRCENYTGRGALGWAAWAGFRKWFVSSFQSGGDVMLGTSKG